MSDLHEPASTAPPPWRTPAQRPAPHGKGTRLVVLLALLLAVLGTLAAWVCYPRALAVPAFYSLAVREYESPRLPTNAFAVQDGNLLLERFAGARQQGYENQGRDQFDKVLQALRTRKEGPIVVHLCALARADDKQVYVLPGDAAADDPAHWVRLGSVLDALRDSPAPHKLLLLDLMRPTADARLGVLTEDLAERVLAEVRQTPLPFLVLCACGPGQLSQTSEIWQRSIFAHYLDQGLRGNADGAGTAGRADSRITVAELASYVQTRVDRWAWQVRGVRQTPVLVGPAALDFPLVACDPETPVVEESSAERQYPDWLRAGWQQRDGWLSDGTLHAQPHLLRPLETALLRAEERWRGGIEEERVKSELTGRLDRWKPSARPTEVRPFVPSLAAALPPDAKSADDLQSIQAALTALLPSVPAPGAKADPELLKTRQELLDRLKKHAYPAAASRLVDVAASVHRLTPALLTFVGDLLRELTPTGTPRTIETVFFDRLKEFQERVKDNGWTWPDATVVQALGTMRRQQALLAELARTPAALPWVAAALEAAETKRLDGEKQLFATEQPATWPEARLRLTQADQLYQTAAGRVALVAQARQQLDEAYAVLPGWADLLVALDTVEAREENAWKTASAAACELTDFLAGPDPERLAGGTPDALRQLHGSLPVLQQSLARHVERGRAAVETGDGSTVRALDALLASPLLAAREREAVWRAGRALTLRLHEAVRQAERAEAEGRSRVVPGENPLARKEITWPRWRARVMLDQLRLAGYEPGAALRKELETSSPDAAVGRTLAEAWSKTLPEQAAARRSRLAFKDRVSRVLPLPDLGRTEPAAALHAEAQGRFSAFLARLYTAEAAALGEGRWSAFFSEAAEQRRSGMSR